MKFLATHFEEYNNSITKYNLHPKLQKCYNKFPSTLNKLGNIITKYGNI